MDPFKILGIRKDATREKIDQAYRERAKKHHPDAGGDTWAFQQVQEAYERLTGEVPTGRSGEDSTRSKEDAERCPSCGRGHGWRGGRCKHCGYEATKGKRAKRTPLPSREDRIPWVLGCVLALIMIMRYSGIEGVRQVVSWLHIPVAIGLGLAAGNFAVKAIDEKQPDQRRKYWKTAGWLAFAGVTIIAILLFGFRTYFHWALAIGATIAGGILLKSSLGRKEQDDRRVQWPAIAACFSAASLTILGWVFGWPSVVIVLTSAGAVFCFVASVAFAALTVRAFYADRHRSILYGWATLAFLPAGAALVATVHFGWSSWFTVVTIACLGLAAASTPRLNRERTQQQEYAVEVAVLTVMVVVGFVGLKIGPDIEQRVKSFVSSLFPQPKPSWPFPASQNPAPEEPLPRPTYLELPEGATPTQIVDAYKDRFFLIDLNCRATVTTNEGAVTEQFDGGGSGIMIANDRKQGVIVTNRHVVDPYYYFDVAERSPLFHPQRSDSVSFSDLSISLRRPGSPKTIKVVSIVRHDQHDLALILVEGEFQKAEALTVVKTSSLKMGDAVLSLGNPAGIGFRVVPGIVSNEPADYIDHSCPIDPGYSGGPLILQRRGRLAGINTAIAGRAVNFAFPAERLLALIEDGKTSKQGPIYFQAGFASKIADNWSALNYAGYAQPNRVFGLASLARLEGENR